MRVDMKNRRLEPFAVNEIEGPASKLPHEGFERPSACVFGPDHALYVVDFGIIRIAPEAGGIRMQGGSGALWRIRRTDAPQGVRPPKPATLPLYLLQGLGLLVGIVGAFALTMWLVRRLRSHR